MKIPFRYTSQKFKEWFAGIVLDTATENEWPMGFWESRDIKFSTTEPYYVRVRARTPTNDGTQWHKVEVNLYIHDFLDLQFKDPEDVDFQWVPSL